MLPDKYWLGDITSALAYFVKGYDEFQICHICGNGVRHKDHYQVDTRITQSTQYGSVANELASIQICSSCFVKAYGSVPTIPEIIQHV